MSAPTHEGAVMDYLVLGPEGSGKRTLAALLAHSGGLSTLDIPAPAAFQEPCVTHIRLPSEGRGDDDDYQDEYEDASPAEITVTTVPSSWWSAALQPGSPEATRLDALCTRKGTPFAAVFVVPLDAYCTDDSGFAPLHEDRSVQEDKEDEKKEEKEGSGTGGVAPLPSLSLAPTAPASVGVPSLLARRRAAAAAAANAQTAPAVVAPSRGRRCLALSVDTAPLTAGARAVRDDVCETPTTCTAPLVPFATPAPTLADVTGALRRVGISPAPSQQPKPRQAPLKNALTRALRAVRHLASRAVVQRATHVFVLLTRADRFAASCPRVASVRCCFPDYTETGAETAAGAAAYVAALFDAALRTVPPAHRHVLPCALVPAADDATSAEAVVPTLLAPARAAETALRTARRRMHAEAALCAARHAAGCVSAPEGAERARLCARSGCATACGRRATNEDACAAADAVCDAAAFAPGATLACYGVYDGHNGAGVAAACTRVVPPQLLYHPLFPRAPERAFRDAYARADRLVAAPGDPSGATAVTAVVFGSTLYVANIGDSECILVSREGQGEVEDSNGKDSNDTSNSTNTNTTTRRENITHTVMTEKHVLTDEAERRRVEACGGTVVFGRLDGTLEVSRAFGDAEYKRPGRALVSVEPHVAVRALARRDELLVLACDGFWDTVPHADAARHAAALRAAGTPPDAAAHALVQLALDRGSTDNVTVVLVYFDWTLNNPS